MCVAASNSIWVFVGLPDTKYALIACVVADVLLYSCKHTDFALVSLEVTSVLSYQTEIRVSINNDTHDLMRDVVTYPYPNFNDG